MEVRLRCASPHDRAATPPGPVNHLWLGMFWSDIMTTAVWLSVPMNQASRQRNSLISPVQISSTVQHDVRRLRSARQRELMR